MAEQEREVEAFLDSLQGVAPGSATACRGWTAHEIVAHLVSGVEGLAEQVEAHVEGRRVPDFGDWAVRELPFRDVDDPVLRRRLEVGEQRMTSALAPLVAVDPDAVLPGVGWGMPVGELVTHMRQEFAVHRWDLIGDDDRGVDLLSRPELLSHCVRMLAEPLLATGLAQDPGRGTTFSVRLRSNGSPDLMLHVADGQARLQLVEPLDATAVVETDPAARLLLLWGRRPGDPSRVRTNLTAPDLGRLQTLLAGF